MCLNPSPTHNHFFLAIHAVCLLCVCVFCFFFSCHPDLNDQHLDGDQARKKGKSGFTLESLLVLTSGRELVFAQLQKGLRHSW